MRIVYSCHAIDEPLRGIEGIFFKKEDAEELLKQLKIETNHPHMLGVSPYCVYDSVDELVEGKRKISEEHFDTVYICPDWEYPRASILAYQYQQTPKTTKKIGYEPPIPY